MLSCRCFENSSVYSGGPKRRINWSKLAKTKQIFALSVNINVLLELCVVVYLSLKNTSLIKLMIVRSIWKLVPGYRVVIPACRGDGD